ncbi:MAG: ThiF family adenylyltransferase [bacterium]
MQEWWPLVVLLQGPVLLMPDNYIPLQGAPITKDDLKIPKAREVAETLKKLSYFCPIEFKRITEPSNGEIIIFDTEVEVGQKTAFDIHRVERMAIVFFPEDNFSPEVLALREDFPRVPHLNLRHCEKPRSLCLFNEKYGELKLHWTAATFLTRIREWLSLTARGELHQDDQPLEPLLISSSSLIVPYDLFSMLNEDDIDLLIIRKAECGLNRVTLIAERIKDSAPFKDELQYAALAIQGAPQPHGIIHRQPMNLLELHEFLKRADIDLLAVLRRRLWIFPEKRKQYPNILNAHLVLIINLPKTRALLGASSDTSVSSDTWAFLMNNSIQEIGVKIGAWGMNDGQIGYILSTDPPAEAENSKGVLVNLLKPIPLLSRELASVMSGFPSHEWKDFLLIGAGALGSQVFMNLIRMGFGEWTLVDEDRLLPHNLVRHALSGFFVGFSKAASLANEANCMFKGKSIAKAIITDVLNPGELSKELNSAYEKAQIIIDASTSLSIARHIARDITTSARRISIFLNPSGSDVVILAEDGDRNITLDWLEMQYYRKLLNDPLFENHLTESSGVIRYARSCNDISNVIPQDLVALHSAICSRAIRNLLSNHEADITIVSADMEELSIKSHHDIPYKNIEIKIGEWTLCTDQWLLDKLFKARSKKLPRETGGVLIGSYDMQRKIAYAVDTILSPPDSKEWPTLYIRGCQGLKAQLERVKTMTASMLDYIGEWHSHPDSASIRPSGDDIKAFAELRKTMDTFGLPALMMIAGNHSQHLWYIGEIE